MLLSCLWHEHLEVPMRTYFSGAKIGSFPDSCKTWSVKSSFSPLFLKEFRLFLNEICLFWRLQMLNQVVSSLWSDEKLTFAPVVRVLIAVRAEVVEGRTIGSTAGNREPLTRQLLYSGWRFFMILDFLHSYAYVSRHARVQNKLTRCVDAVSAVCSRSSWVCLTRLKLSLCGFVGVCWVQR